MKQDRCYRLRKEYAGVKEKMSPANILFIICNINSLSCSGGLSAMNRNRDLILCLWAPIFIPAPKKHKINLFQIAIHVAGDLDSRFSGAQDLSPNNRVRLNAAFFSAAI